MDDFVISHGSLVRAMQESFGYISKSQVGSEAKHRKLNFDLLKTLNRLLLYYGHDHQQARFVDTSGFPTGAIEPIPDPRGIPTAAMSPYQTVQVTDIEKAPEGVPQLVDVGSVGQPRDYDARACYVIHSGGPSKVVRVEYEIKITQQKIRDSGLPEETAELLAKRLAIGR
jgi:hypothetical protein